MKIALPPLLVCLLFFASSVSATNVVIIESSISNPVRPMDSLWNVLCHSLGYNSTIYHQTKLDSTDWFCSTDVLIVSSGRIDLPANRISTIQSYLGQGGRVYLQSEYGCDSNIPDWAFEQIVDSLGGAFNWLGSISSYMGNSNLVPMDVFGTIADIPDTVNTLETFIGGCYGAGIGVNSHITPFLKWNGWYFGFIFNVPNSCGIMITQSDEDWVMRGISVPLMTNMLTYLVNRTGNCIVPPGPFNVYAGNDTSMCRKDTITINAVGSGAVSYLWSNNDTGILARITAPGMYWVQASNNACVVSDTINVLQARTGFQYQLADSEICKGHNVLLLVKGATGLTVYPSTGVAWWSSSKAFLQPDSTTYYALTGQTTCGNIDTVNFKLTVDQPVNLNLSTDKSSICSGDTAHVQALGNYSSYLWNTGDTSSLISVFTPGVYHLHVTQGTCAGNDSIQIKQRAESFNYALSDSEICQGNSASITIAGGNNLLLYPGDEVLWQDSLLASLQPDSTTNYILTGQTACGNNDTTSFTMWVDQPVGVNLESDQNSICEGDTVFILASGNYTQWRWSTGDSISPWLNVDMPGTYTITAYRGACSAHDSIKINQRTTAFQYLLTDSQVCAGTSVILTIKEAVNPALYPDINVIWKDSTDAILQADSSTRYLLVAQTDCGNMDTAQVSLNVFPPVVAKVLPDSATICSGDSLQMCVPGNFVSYAWNIGDTNACIYASQTGNYYLTVTDIHSCSVESTHASLLTYSTSSISVVVAGDTLSSFGYDHYQWKLNDTLLPGINSDKCIAKITGYYSVSIIDTNGCSACSAPVYIVVNGVAELYRYPIEIYPNPTVDGSWQLIADDNLLGSAIEVYDEEGRIVFKSKIRNAKSEISTIGLPSGIYFVQIYTDEGNMVRRLVKL